MGIRAEESAWFDIAYLGSGGAFDLLDPACLSIPRSDTGRSLESTLIELGFDPQDLGATSDSPAAVMDDRLRASLMGLLDRPFEMPSGAGHDAAVFAKLGIPTGMIFVRNENGSHNPDEAMTLDDFAVATQALIGLLLQESS
jgi:acetylornithine deacetylase/succinyl-diaminopimelate desuccinylase-like protein